jgi:ABC-type proline/glycine betaine transport system substrate-binding protein
MILHQLWKANKEHQMFLTIGFVVGFIAGWWVNEKVENLGEKINPIKWFKK